VLGTQPYLISPLEANFSFTVSSSRTNISIYNFFHFLLLSTKVYETPQKKVHLFHLFICLNLSKAQKKKSTCRKTPRTQNNTVSEKLECALQGGRLSQHSLSLLFHTSKLHGEQTTVIQAGFFND